MSKFKKGDKVVFTLKERPDYFVDNGDMDYMLNEGAVLEIDGEGMGEAYVVIDPELGKWHIREEHLKLYEEEEQGAEKMNKFKIGDRVVCVAKERPFYFNHSGLMDYMLNEGAVLEVVRGTKYMVIDHKDPELRKWRIRGEDLKLYDEAKTKEDVLETLNDRIKRELKNILKEILDKL